VLKSAGFDVFTLTMKVKLWREFLGVTVVCCWAATPCRYLIPLSHLQAILLRLGRHYSVHAQVFD